MSILAAVASHVNVRKQLFQPDVAFKERRRRWGDEKKLDIVMSIGLDGATVTEVAHRHNVSRQQIYAWRHELKKVSVLLVELVNSLEQEKAQGKSGADRQSARPFRSRHSRRAGISAIQCLRRSFALPSAEQTLRAHQCHYHHQPQLQ